MRRPTRPSRPTRSERRRERSEPSERPVSFMGICTRRPSVVTTPATWRRFRPSNRPNAVSRTRPGRPGRFAQSTRRPVIVQPPAPHGFDRARTTGPAIPVPDMRRPSVARRSPSHRRPSERGIDHAFQRCPASTTSAELAIIDTAMRIRKAWAFSIFMVSTNAGRRRSSGPATPRAPAPM
jgi:hypothetical protein